MSSCARCGRDLSSLPSDLAFCPYCGASIKRITLCPNCGRDLTTIPSDIKTCPYCGKPLTERPALAQPDMKTGGSKLVVLGVILFIIGILNLFLVAPLSLLMFAIGGILIVLGLRGAFEKLERKVSS
jgi:DNA-directed RNA polymerase subunit RPC12/RpoP